MILEVGSGAGALTTLMAARGPTVIAVDVDRAMARLTAESVAGLPNVRVLNLDALAGKHTIHPTVLDNVRQALAAGERTTVQGRREPALSCRDSADHELAGSSGAVPRADGGHDSTGNGRSAVRCAGKPGVRGGLGRGAGARRRVARPGAAALGLLAAAEGRLGGRRHPARVLRSEPPWSTWPDFTALVRRVFLHRRKYLRHALAAMWPEQWTKADVDRWLESQGQSGQLRAEALDVDGIRGTGPTPFAIASASFREASRRAEETERCRHEHCGD